MAEARHLNLLTPFKAVGIFLDKVIEKRIMDKAVEGVGRILNYFSRRIRLVQGGQVSTYLLFTIWGLIVLLIISIVWK